jgi:muramoyltetrapeptide carboxypeptidase
MPKVVKPPALEPASVVRIVAPASPVEEAAFRQGLAELERIGYRPAWDPRVLARQGFFAGSAEERSAKLVQAFEEDSSQALICARGGYGSNYMLDLLEPRKLKRPKALVGFSDITSLQLYLWRKKRWVAFYGPMVAAGFDHGEGAAQGYDLHSFEQAMTQTNHGWSVDLRGETMCFGKAEGTLLGGCLTLVEATLGTPWEIQTTGTILLLEDRGMKPYQVDRAMMHMRQAGKLKNLRGMLLGEFPECGAEKESATVREVFERIAEPLRIPIVWGVPVGHTQRPMLTFPLGIRARIIAQGSGRLEFLEPACMGTQLVSARKEKSSRRS